MHTRLRMIAAGAAVALITGAASAAAASSGSSPSSSASSSGATIVKPSPTASDGKSGDPQFWLNQLAASLHIDPQRLMAALGDAKRTMGQLGVGPQDPRVAAVVAHDLGISTEKAATVVKEVFGTNGPGKGGTPSRGPGIPDQQVISTFAGILHVSQERAAQVLDQLSRIGRGISLTDPQFVAIAASLHITPQQLSQDLMTLKQDLRASMPTSTASPKS